MYVGIQNLPYLADLHARAAEFGCPENIITTFDCAVDSNGLAYTGGPAPQHITENGVKKVFPIVGNKAKETYAHTSVSSGGGIKAASHFGVFSTQIDVNASSGQECLLDPSVNVIHCRLHDAPLEYHLSSYKEDDSAYPPYANASNKETIWRWDLHASLIASGENVNSSGSFLIKRDVFDWHNPKKNFKNWGRTGARVNIERAERILKTTHKYELGNYYFYLIAYSKRGCVVFITNSSYLSDEQGCTYRCYCRETDLFTTVENKNLVLPNGDCHSDSRCKGDFEISEPVFTMQTLPEGNSSNGNPTNVWQLEIENSSLSPVFHPHQGHAKNYQYNVTYGAKSIVDPGGNTVIPEFGTDTTSNGADECHQCWNGRQEFTGSFSVIHGGTRQYGIYNICGLDFARFGKNAQVSVRLLRRKCDILLNNNDQTKTYLDGNNRYKQVVNLGQHHSCNQWGVVATLAQTSASSNNSGPIVAEDQSFNPANPHAQKLLNQCYLTWTNHPFYALSNGIGAHAATGSNQGDEGGSEGLGKIFVHRGLKEGEGYRKSDEVFNRMCLGVGYEYRLEVTEINTGVTRYSNIQSWKFGGFYQKPSPNVVLPRLTVSISSNGTPTLRFPGGRNFTRITLKTCGSTLGNTHLITVGSGSSIFRNRVYTSTPLGNFQTGVDYCFRISVLGVDNVLYEGTCVCARVPPPPNPPPPPPSPGKLELELKVLDSACVDNCKPRYSHGLVSVTGAMPPGADCSIPSTYVFRLRLDLKALGFSGVGPGNPTGIGRHIATQYINGNATIICTSEDGKDEVFQGVWTTHGVGTATSIIRIETLDNQRDYFDSDGELFPPGMNGAESKILSGRKYSFKALVTALDGTVIQSNEAAFYQNKCEDKCYCEKNKKVYNATNSGIRPEIGDGRTARLGYCTEHHEECKKGDKIWDPQLTLKPTLGARCGKAHVYLDNYENKPASVGIPKIYISKDGGENWELAADMIRHGRLEFRSPTGMVETRMVWFYDVHQNGDLELDHNYIAEARFTENGDEQRSSSVSWSNESYGCPEEQMCCCVDPNSGYEICDVPCDKVLENGNCNFSTPTTPTNPTHSDCSGFRLHPTSRFTYLPRYNRYDAYIEFRHVEPRSWVNPNYKSTLEFQICDVGNNQTQWKTIASQAKFHPGTYRNYSAQTTFNVTGLPTGTRLQGRGKFTASDGTTVCYTAAFSIPSRGYENRLSPLYLINNGVDEQDGSVIVNLEAQKDTIHFVHPLGVHELLHIDEKGRSTTTVISKADSSNWQTFDASVGLEKQTGIHRFKVKTYLSNDPASAKFSNEIEVNTDDYFIYIICGNFPEGGGDPDPTIITCYFPGGAFSEPNPIGYPYSYPVNNGSGNPSQFPNSNYLAGYGHASIEGWWGGMGGDSNFAVSSRENNSNGKYNLFISDNADTADSELNYFTCKIPSILSSGANGTNIVTGYNHVKVTYTQKKAGESQSNTINGDAIDLENGEVESPTECFNQSGYGIDKVYLTTGVNSEVSITLDQGTHTIKDFQLVNALDISVSENDDGFKNVSVTPHIYQKYTGIANWKDIGGLQWHLFKSIANSSSAYHSFGPDVDGIKCLLGGGHRGGFESSANAESPASGAIISLVDNYLRNLGWVSGVAAVGGAELGSITNECGSEDDICWDKTSARAATVELKVNWQGCIDYPRSKSTCTLSKKVDGTGPAVELGTFYYCNTGEAYYPTEYRDTIYIPKVGEIDKSELDPTTIGSEFSYACKICNYAYIEMTGSGGLIAPDYSYLVDSGNASFFAPSETGILEFSYSTDVWNPICCENTPTFSGTISNTHEQSYQINNITVPAFCPENPFCSQDQIVDTLTDYYEDESPLKDLFEPSYYKVSVSNSANHQISTSLTRYSISRNDNSYYNFNHGSLDQKTVVASGSGIFDQTNSTQISNYPHSLTEKYHNNYFVIISEDSEHSNSIRREIHVVGDDTTADAQWNGSSGILIKHSGDFSSDFSSPILNSGELVNFAQAKTFADCGERRIEASVGAALSYSPVEVKIKNTSDTEIKVGIGAGVYTHFFGVSESTGGTYGNRSWKSFSSPEAIPPGATSTVYLSDKNPDWFALSVIKEYKSNGTANRGVEDLFIIPNVGYVLAPEVVSYIENASFSYMPSLTDKTVHQLASSKSFDTSPLTFEYSESFSKVSDVTATFTEPNNHTIAGEGSAFAKTASPSSTVNNVVNIPDGSISSISDAKHFRFIMTQGEIEERTDTFSNSIVTGYGYDIQSSLSWQISGSGSDPYGEESEEESNGSCADLDSYISTQTSSAGRIVAYYNTVSSPVSTSNSYGGSPSLAQVEDIYGGCDCSTSGPPEVINGNGFSDDEVRDFKVWWNVYTASCEHTLSGDPSLTVTINNTGTHSIYVATGDSVWSTVAAGGSWSNDFSQYQINANGTQDSADSSQTVGHIQVSGSASSDFTRTTGTPKYYSYGHFSDMGIKTTSTLRLNSHSTSNSSKGGPSYHQNHYSSDGVLGQLSSITGLHNFDISSSELYGPVKDLNHFDVFVANGFAGNWEGFDLTYEATYGSDGNISTEKKYIKSSDMNIEVYSGKHTINVS